MKIIATKSFVFKVDGFKPIYVYANAKPQVVPDAALGDPLYHLAVAEGSVLELVQGNKIVPNLTEADLEEQARVNKQFKENANTTNAPANTAKKIAAAVAAAKDAVEDASDSPVVDETVVHEHLDANETGSCTAEDAYEQKKAAAPASTPVGSSSLPTSGEGTGPASGPSTKPEVIAAKLAAQQAIDSQTKKPFQAPTTSAPAKPLASDQPLGLVDPNAPAK